jgi:hypothetical protein
VGGWPGCFCAGVRVAGAAVQVAWSADVWAALDAAVHDEFHRSAVALKFIPFSGQVDNAMTVSADVVDLDTMTIDESAVVALVELGVEFGLTRQQTAAEAQNQTGVALATRAANLLAQAEDRVIFLGGAAFDDPLFKRVQRRSGDAGLGLLGAAEQAVSVEPFPGLDAGSKDAAFLTVKLSPEYTQWVVGQKTPFAFGPGIKGGVQKKWLVANFALQIDGLDCTRVQAIDPLTARLAVEEDAVSEPRDYQSQPARLDVPELAVTMPDIHAGTFRAWLEDFVIKGNNGPGAEKHGTLEYRSPTQEVYFTLTFQNLGIIKLTRLPVTAADKIRLVRAEMYCEQIELQPGAVTMPGPVQSAEAGPESALIPTASPSFTVADKWTTARLLTPLGAVDAPEARVAGLRFRR